MIGAQSALLVLGVVLLLFGGKKLPELAGALGRSMKEFKKSVESSDEAVTAASSPASRTCGACKASVQEGWSHCAQCGTAVAPNSTATPQA